MSQRLYGLSKPALHAPTNWLQSEAVFEMRNSGGGAQLAHVSEAGLLEVIGAAAFLLEPGGRTVARNAKGARLLRDGKILSDRGGRLKPVRSRDEAALQKSIARAADGRSAAAPVLLRLGASGLAATYLVRLIPLPRVPQVLMLVHPLAPASIAPSAIQAAFGLSAAEAPLGGALVAGRTLSEYAAENRLSRNTARNQLSAIFAKTGTRRQTEFVALVVAALGPGWARGGE